MNIRVIKAIIIETLIELDLIDDTVDISNYDRLIDPGLIASISGPPVGDTEPLI